jgi:glycosyltransferase involved in cell wall biosynthesis
MARILFVSPISTSGGPVYILKKILESVSQRHQVEVVAPGKGELYEFAVQQMLPYHQAGEGREGLGWRRLPWLYRLVRKGRFDLVYGCSFRTGPRNALIAARLAGRPFLWHINELLKGPKQVNRLNAFCLRYASLLIGDALPSLAAIQQYVPGKPVHLVYNGLEAQEFQLDKDEMRRFVRQELGAPPDAQVVLNAGLLCERKSQHYALEAAIRLAASRPQAWFAFLGGDDFEPAYARRLYERSAASGYGERIRFLGFRQDFAQFVAGSTLYLHSAVRDPLPMVILGAMAAGLPVVAFGVDGVPEQVIDGETGFLLPAKDVDGLVQATGRCLDDPELSRRLGEGGVRRVREVFSAEAMCAKVNTLIDSLL